MNIIESLFGKRLTPDEQIKEWKTKIRSEQRVIERDVRQITLQENNTKKQCLQLAKKGDNKSCRVLAKELVRSQKVKDRLVTSKTQLNSLVMQLGEIQATAKVMGTLKKSTQVMQLVNKLVKVDQISMVMQEMSKEMMKAGIIDEMIQDTIEGMDGDSLEEEAEEQVETLLFEITNGLLGEAGGVGAALEVNLIPTSSMTNKNKVNDEESVKRLNALRS